jgi:hypothetical protein
MPRLESFTLKLKTGAQGLPATPKYAINGFPLDFDEIKGGTAPGDEAELTGNPQSFPHSLVLIGPEEGEWDIEGMTITYNCAGSQPYNVRLGAITLQDDTDLNIWHQRPARVLDT